MKSSSMLRRAADISAGLLIVATLLTMAACASAPPPAPPPTVSISAKVPMFTLLPGEDGQTKDSQDKGGVEIALVPVAYQTVKREKTTLVPVAPGFGAMLGASIATGGNSGQLVYVQRTTEPRLDVEPGTLAFTVRINNKLNRVFRGQGSVVQINVDGAMIPFDRVDYKPFINGIVPPRNEASFTIAADALNTLRDKGTIGIFLYDVVTATDVAGNTTEKQNYQWLFSYETKIVEQRAERTVVQGHMDAAEYQAEMARQQQEQMMSAMRSAQSRAN